ncbi:MAG TPA: septum site-determining protein Ssd [Jiangellaceae bacterium]|nr:septum site-determining protein Ssd [Jiangellaceae bacterium]
MSPSPAPQAAARPLLVTADDGLLDDLLRLATAAGVEVDVAADAGSARARWCAASIVVVGDDQTAAIAAAGPGRRRGVIVVGLDLDDADVWRRAVAVGADDVVFLPDSEPWLADRFADAAESGGRDGAVIGVVGGRGGAGASVLAAALAVTATRLGLSSMLIDLDPLGGGVDLVIGAEDCTGLRWPDFAETRGRLGGAELCRSLPSSFGLTVLSWDRGDVLTVPAEAVRAVLTAAQRSCDVVVLDLPRRVDAATEHALARCTCTMLVVPAEVRAVAAAARVATGLAAASRDVRIVVRGPSPSGLGGADVAEALGLTLAVEMDAERRLDDLLERGEAPGRSGKGPLARACEVLLADVVPSAPVRAA